MPRESLKNYDNFLNCKLFLIESKVNEAFSGECSITKFIGVLAEIRKICQANYETIVNYMENKQ